MSTCGKNNMHKISRIFRTKCQKSFHSYVHQHACAEKLTYFYICLLKIYGMHAQNNHLGLLLDLSAKDTAIELMYINMHVGGNVWN